MVKQWISWQQIGLGVLGSVLTMPLALAQNVQIIPAPNGTGTVVEVNGQQYNIRGGAFSGDGRNLFHLFREFGLNNGQIANFLANPQLRNILAGVSGGHPSVINGLLQVSGGNPNLYLLNPAGIIFGANAQLNVPAAFAATTATGAEFGGGWFSLTGKNNFENLVGNPLGFAFTGNQAGSIINEGNLSVNPGQSLLLLGGNVVNTGNLSAPGGEITVAAVPGQSLVRISQAGQLLSLDVRTPQPGDSLPNDWQLPILSLPELLTGPGAGHVAQVSVNPDGSIRLGTTAIPYAPGMTAIGGFLNVGQANLGGSLTVLGSEISLVRANLNADGRLGGGTIRIGGDYQGGNTLPQAQFVNVEANSVIAANALSTGDGGRVILWSQDQTRLSGQITARGGTLRGDGGFIETSSKNILSILGGSVDAGANLGAAGTWLLDPTAITIVASGGGAIGTSVIDVGLINSALNSNTNVTLTTNIDISGGDILQNADAKINHTANNQPTLSMIASGAITLLGGINSSFSGLNVSLSAGDSAGGPVDPNVSHQISIAGPQQLTMRTLTTKTDAWTQLQQSIKTRGNQTYSSFVSIAPDSNASVPFTLESTTGSLIFNDQLSITSNLVALVANNFQFNGGNGSITGLGGTIALATNGLFTVNQDLIKNFASGFSLIGLASQSNTAVELSSDITVASPLQIGFNPLNPSTVNNFKIDTKGHNISVTGANNSLILQGPGGVTTNNLTTTNGPIIASTSASQTDPTTNLLASPIVVNSVNSGNSPLAFLTTGTLAAGSLDTSGTLTLQATNGITLNGQVGGSLAPISLVAVGPTTIRDSITTSGNQLYTGAVTINASNPTTSTSPLTLTSQNGILSFGNTLAAGANYLELFTNGADAVGFNGGTASVSGTKGITFASDNSLVVNQSVITPLADGFESIAFISQAPSSTQVTLTSDLTVTDPLVLFGPGINTNNFTITGTGNASLTIQGFENQLFVTGLNTQGSDITVTTGTDRFNPNSNLTFLTINTTTGPIVSPITSNGGNISLLTQGNIDTGNLNSAGSSNSGNITLSGANISTVSGTIASPMGLGQVNITANDDINLGAFTPAANSLLGVGAINVTSTNGNITLNDLADIGSSKLTLSAHRNITTENITTAGQAINITSNIGDINTSSGTLASNDGVITLQNNVGKILTGPINSSNGNLTLSIAGIGGAINAGSLVSQNGAINITTNTADINLSAVTTLAGPINLASTSGNISTGNLSSTTGPIQATTGSNLTTGTINTMGALNLQGSDVNLNGAIGGTTAPSSLSINATSANTTTITNDIKTIGSQVYIGNVDIIPTSPTTVFNPLVLESTAGTLTFNNNLDVGANNLALKANGFNFNGSSGSVSGTGSIILTGNSTLSIDSTLLSPLGSGFSLVGLASPSGVTVTNDLTVSNPFQIFAPVINVQNITATGSAGITLQGPGGITAKDLTTNTGTMIVSTSSNITNPTINLIPTPITIRTVTSNSGNISLLTAGTLTTGALNTSGNVTLTGTQGINLSTVGNSVTPSNLIANGPTVITSNIRVDNNLTFTNSVIINSATLSSPLQLDANLIRFNSTLNTGSGDVVLLADAFQANGGAGSVSGTGSLTLGTQGALTINSSNLTPLSDGFRLLVLGTGGGINLASDVSFSDPIVLGTLGNINTKGFSIIGTDNASVTLRTFSSAADLQILLAGGINLNTIAQIPSGSGNITTGSISTAGQAIMISTNGLVSTGPISNASNVTLNGLGGITLGGPVNVASLTATGPVAISNNVTTTGNSQTYNGAVTITGLTTLASNAGSITFNSTLDGAADLILQASAINFNGNVGSITPLTTLTTTGNINVGGTVTTSGNQVFNSPATIIGSNSAFRSTNGNLNFNSISSNGQVINLQAANNIATGPINSSNSSGNGGNVSLIGNAIQVSSINAQGSQAGGSATVNANSRFESTSTFTDQNGVDASISAAGGISNGNIRIQINSAAPFVVGGTSENGTAGAITTGTNNTISNQTFPVSTTVGNFELITLGALTPEQKQQASVVLQGQENSQSALSLVNPPPTTLINRDFSLEVALFEELQCQTFSNYFGRSLCKRPQSLEEVKGILAQIANQTGQNPSVIYVLSRPQQVELLLVTGIQEPIRHVIPGVTQAQLNELAQQFSNQVRDPRFIGTNAYLSNAQKLYQILIQPLQADLQSQKVDTLLFSLDTGLRTIPLAALHNGQRFLVEEYALGLIPSMSLINPTYRDIRKDKILAMGAETFPDLAPLPAVPIELATITQDLGGGVKFLNQDFTVRKLESERGRQDFAVVHLATHGEFNPGSVKDSFIAFSDRRVNLEQMRRLRLNLPTTDLLTLSACRTAVGDEQAELGFAGLAVQSGIKTALASLWYVSDEGTLGLMTEFYQQLGQAPIKAEALRQAQLAMIRGQVSIKNGELISASRPNAIKLPPGLANVPNRLLNHPYYWAAFTMIGSPW
ncbi:CHAT domain-containing protein [Synechococcus sp. PCC 6312]|uniref:CHAT domain-containing protein n=1 Tax=Synechococcus sp. (strain ATCC 27167 / PCC 6312) TaxID=195253 RepID=UPI00029F3C49|nr:CHAT domain-containing protein [Synechococcus sp. PCC 6312]AFY60173.1 filamentous hemagglutinin family N-terminal domain protein [Synechococcus sp. PCC 6312]